MQTQVIFHQQMLLPLVLMNIRLWMNFLCDDMIMTSAHHQGYLVMFGFLIVYEAFTSVIFKISLLLFLNQENQFPWRMINFVKLKSLEL